MSSSRRHVRPVIVEVSPSSNPTPTPSSPTPKTVRFAPSSNNAESRPLSNTEAWSLYHFENHARHCLTCHHPSSVFLRGGQLCPIGHGLAQDVAYHVYHLDGQFYSTASKSSPTAKLVRVEVPANYIHLRSLLRSMDRALRTRHTQRPVPIISYDRSYPISARRYSDTIPTPERGQVILEPASSPREKKKSHRHSSKHKSQRYSTIVVDSDENAAVDSGYEYEDGDYSVKAPRSPSREARRNGVLYERERERRKENYRVEIREPSRRREREERRRGSMFWD